jgi:TolA-binding protein
MTMTMQVRKRTMPRLAVGVSVALLGATLGGACVLRPAHEELKQEVYRLKDRTAEQDKALEETLKRANDQLAVLDEKIAAAEKVLRTTQAGLAVRVENLESDLGALRGGGEDILNELSSAKRGLEEVRTDLDTRINALETKLNAATDIPESKSELLAAGDDAMQAKQYARARRLLRTYLSRYPDDDKGPEIRFKIGLTLYNEQDYRSALSEFAWIKKNAPNSPLINDTIYYLGLGLAKTGECAKAVAYFEFLAGPKSKAPKTHKEKAQKQIELLKTSASQLCKDTAGVAAGGENSQ